MATLLVVHHTVSPATDDLLDAVLRGTTADGIEGVDVVVRAALAATPADVLAADGYLLGTPANLGYMSGALKHFIDTVYYTCRRDTVGRPYAAWVHGDNDTAGAIRGIQVAATGLGWTAVAPVLSLTGPVDAAAREAAYEVGGTVAATLMA